MNHKLLLFIYIKVFQWVEGMGIQGTFQYWFKLFGIIRQVFDMLLNLMKVGLLSSIYPVNLWVYFVPIFNINQK